MDTPTEQVKVVENKQSETQSPSGNGNYLLEIIQKGDDAYNENELKQLKTEAEEEAKAQRKYLKVAEKQIKDLCQSIDSLDTQSGTHLVNYYINVGKILNEVENSILQKSLYNTWFKEKFGYEHIRYFQHAKQLAKMGNFASEYAYLGKKRLVQLDHIKRSKNLKSFENILNNDHYKEYIPSGNGNSDKISKTHTDAIISMYRFWDKDIDFIKFEQAMEMVKPIYSAVKVSTIDELKKWLDKLENIDEEKKRDLAIKYINNDLENLEDEQSKKLKEIKNVKEGPNKLLNAITKFYNKIDFDKSDKVKKLKETISRDSIIKAHKSISELMSKLNIPVSSE